MFHDDADLAYCIQDEFPGFLTEFLQMRLPPFKIETADAGRYCILWKYGGIYADLDYEATRNFYDQLPSGKVSLDESPYEENIKLASEGMLQVQNALMASP